MAESSIALHEHHDQITSETMEMRRGIVSLMEEFEAIDWYSQRIDAAHDTQLKAILAHNRDEEKEHAVMTLEWLRRRDPELDTQLRTYLFTDSDIVATEDDEEGEASTESDAAPPGDGSLGVGSLREVRP